MNVYIVSIFLFILTIEVLGLDDGIKGSGNSKISSSPAIKGGNQRKSSTTTNKKPSSASSLAQPPKGVQDHTEIIPLNNEDDDDDEEDDESESETLPIAENKRVPVPPIMAAIVESLARKLLARTSKSASLSASTKPLSLSSPGIKVEIGKQHEDNSNPNNNNNGDGSDVSDSFLKQNWWERKDLRLRKLHKKLDQDEQQMMELMYGFALQ